MEDYLLSLFEKNIVNGIPKVITFDGEYNHESIIFKVLDSDLLMLNKYKIDIYTYKVEGNKLILQ